MLKQTRRDLRRAQPAKIKEKQIRDPALTPRIRIRKGRMVTLQPMSRLSLVRYVDGEIAHVVRPIPAGKKGFHMKAGAPLNEKALRMTVTSASAINPGDNAQITNLEFKDKEIIVDINGGGKGKTRLRDRIHMEIGGVPTATTTPENAVNTNAGATIYLDFDKSLPDMNPDDLEKLLSPFWTFPSSIRPPYNGSTPCRRKCRRRSRKSSRLSEWITKWSWPRWDVRTEKFARNLPRETKWKTGFTENRPRKQFS